MQYKNVNRFFGTLQLADGIDRPGIGHVQLLRTGKFKHPSAPNGEFEITTAMLENMKSNFENNVRRLDKGEVAVDYGHDTNGKAAGWIKAVSVENDDFGGSSLFIDTDWTEAAEESILKREWRFLSADIDFDYKDNETNASLGPTLLGAGLVNRPHIKGMNAVFNEEITTDKPTKEFSMTPEEMMKKIGELEQRILELESKLKAREASLQDAEKKAEDMEGEKAKLSEELKKIAAEKLKLAEEKTAAQKDAKFNEYLKEGKVLPAQKDAFMEMSLELAEKTFKDVKLNLSDKGHGTESKNDGGEDDAAAAIEKRAKDLMKENSKLTLGEAYSQVMSQDKELAKKYDESTTNIQV